jgi:hypothetical protein
MNYYNPETGAYIPNPLPKTKQWAGSTDKPLPAYDTTAEQCRFAGDEWTIEFIPVVAKTRSETMARLTAIDMESIRALRAIQAGRGKPFDSQKLAALEDEAEVLRAELTTLWPDQQGLPLRAPVLASPGF